MVVMTGKSRTTYHLMNAVYMVNVVSFNPQVPGSNPGGVTTHKPYNGGHYQQRQSTFPRRLIAPDDKTDDKTVPDHPETVLCATRRRGPPWGQDSSRK